MKAALRELEQAFSRWLGGIRRTLMISIGDMIAGLVTAWFGNRIFNELMNRGVMNVFFQYRNSAVILLVIVYGFGVLALWYKADFSENYGSDLSLTLYTIVFGIGVHAGVFGSGKVRYFGIGIAGLGVVGYFFLLSAALCGVIGGAFLTLFTENQATGTRASRFIVYHYITRCVRWVHTTLYISRRVLLVVVMLTSLGVIVTNTAQFSRLKNTIAVLAIIVSIHLYSIEQSYKKADADLAEDKDFRSGVKAALRTKYRILTAPNRLIRYLHLQAKSLVKGILRNIYRLAQLPAILGRYIKRVLVAYPQSVWETIQTWLSSVTKKTRQSLSKLKSCVTSRFLQFGD